MRKFILIAVVITLVGVGGTIFYLKSNQASQSITSTAPEQSQVNQQPAVDFDKNQYSLHDPTSIWVIVNKKNALPSTYEPELVTPNVKLRLSAPEPQMHIGAVAEPALEEMFGAAKAEGVNLVFGSGYRSAILQKQFYDSYVAHSGQADADTYSARPGHSEHQTGLALDVTSASGTCHLEICWKDTLEGKWLAKNAYKYGFVIRYPAGKESITGYQYEPWHVRYVGKELAAQINQSSQTLEEFFELGPANTYD